MKCIGFTKETYGQYKHLGMMLILGSIPDPLYNLAIKYSAAKKKGSESKSP